MPVQSNAGHAHRMPLLCLHATIAATVHHHGESCGWITTCSSVQTSAIVVFDQVCHHLSPRKAFMQTLRIYAVTTHRPQLYLFLTRLCETWCARCKDMVPVFRANTPCHLTSSGNAATGKSRCYARNLTTMRTGVSTNLVPVVMISPTVSFHVSCKPNVEEFLCPHLCLPPQAFSTHSKLVDSIPPCVSSPAAHPCTTVHPRLVFGSVACFSHTSRVLHTLPRTAAPRAITCSPSLHCSTSQACVSLYSLFQSHISSLTYTTKDCTVTCILFIQMPDLILVVVRDLCTP